MFKCLDCENQFEEPEVTYENIGEYMGAPAMQPFNCCPTCHSDDIVIMRKCKACGGWIDEGDYCPECLKIRDKALFNAIQEIHKWSGCGYEKARELLFNEEE